MGSPMNVKPGEGSCQQHAPLPKQLLMEMQRLANDQNAKLDTSQIESEVINNTPPIKMTQLEPEPEINI